jgi:phosphoglycolate phosphatase-like HAD superfamily hydrolase
MKTGLISNVGKRVLEKAIQKLNLQQLFNVVVTRNDVRSPKPSSEGILLALNHIGVKKENAFFIGDSIDDVYAAKNASLRVIVILGGENPEPDLLTANPDFLINDFGEFLVF